MTNKIRKHRVGKMDVTIRVIEPEEYVKIIREAMKKAGIEEEDFNKVYYREVWETVLSVLKRALFTVERYAQVLAVDLSDRGLMTDMVSKVEKVDKGMRLTVELYPKEECILEAVKNAKFRRLISQMAREVKRIKKARIYVPQKA